ncbi:aldo/keto reductase [Myxococcus sp. AM011]|uniref:aldo/keto reductase n=1 Tax=Myxococcus sp. AM011 TaxID=2745200 RepID=UPI0020CC22BE|nr:aldo/keto reductase [Myxococcus sp. AM011]
MRMEYRRLGQSGLRVSTLCFGTMALGEPLEGSASQGFGTDEKTSLAILDRALEVGINFLDTANVYGMGVSETLIGKWFGQGNERRDQMVLASKFRLRLMPGPNNAGGSRLSLRTSVEDSLRRLKTDRIDLYQVHMQDVDTPVEETLRAMEDLVRQGKVLYIGASNYAAYRMVDALWTSRHLGLSRFVSLQAQYSLVVRDAEREYLPLCEHLGVGLLAWAPLASGFLSGKYRQGQEPPEATRLAVESERRAEFDTPRNWRVLAEVEAVAKELDATPAQVSLAWLLHKKAVTSVVFGARSVSQFDENLKAAALKLDAAQMKRLDAAGVLDPGTPYAFIRHMQGRW